MRKYYVDGPLGQVHIGEQGEGPALVLLPQTAWSSLQYKNAMPYLAARGIRCIAVDTPGYGMSDGPESPPAIRDYVDSLAAVIEALGLNEPTVLGHHTGASIATAFGAAYPAMVARLLLHGVPIYTDEERAQRLAKPHYDQTPREDGSHITDRWSLLDPVSGNTATQEAFHWSIVHFFWAGENEWFGHHAAYNYDLETDFKALTVPTVVISNSGDRLHEKMPYLEALRPDFTYTSIDGGSIGIMVDDAQRWASVVADHIHKAKAMTRPGLASSPKTPRGRNPIKPRRGYVDGPTGQVHYRAFGDGIPLILSHQSPSSSNMFRKAYPILARSGIMAIGVDTPGFGNSDVPEPRPSVSDYASAFGPVMDHFGLASANFLGHHTGAANVAEFAHQSPDRVEKIILNGPPVFSAGERSSKVAKPGPSPIQADGSHLKVRWDARMAATPGWTDLDAMHNNVLQTLWAGGTFWYGHKAAYEYDITDALMGLKMPALILTNTGDDIYFLSCRARSMRPDMTFVELEGGTHDIVDEQPEAWSQAVISFIKGS